jgi:hypothetical protein
MTEAEELRAAAAKLRETAANASPGPWSAQDFAFRHGLADAAWIALMDPAVAEPLAAWLEETARQYEMPPCDFPDGVCNSCERRDDFVHAMAVAHIINGNGATT